MQIRDDQKPKIIGIFLGFMLALVFSWFVSTIPNGEFSDWLYLLGTSSVDELDEINSLIETYQLGIASFLLVLTVMVSIVFDFGGYFSFQKWWRFSRIIIFLGTVILIVLMLLPHMAIQRNFLMTALVFGVLVLAVPLGVISANYLYARFEIADGKRRAIGVTSLYTYFVILGIARALGIL